MLSSLRAVSALTLALGVAGCAAGPRTTGPVIRVAYAGAMDFDDVPSVIAHEQLRARGYRIDVVVFSQTEQAAEALSRGDVDVAHGALRTFWAARAKGANVVTLMEHVGDVHTFVTRSEIAGCESLRGRTVGIQGPGAGGTALLDTFLAESCPDASVGKIAIARSSNRAAALLSGGLDAAVLELNQWIWLDAQAPGRFRLAQEFGRRWPNVRTSGVHANRRFVESYPVIVQVYLGARIEANRLALSDSAVLVTEANRTVGASSIWPRSAAAYVSSQLWSPDGGLSTGSVAESLQFLQRHGQLAPNVGADDLVDLSHLEQARENLRGPDARRVKRIPGAP